MYASIVETHAKPGKTEDLIAAVTAALPELGQVAGIKQLITLDMGDDKGLSVVVYESEADREAAQPIAQEILGRWADLYAAMPKRQGGEVLINESF